MHTPHLKREELRRFDEHSLDTGVDADCSDNRMTPDRPLFQSPGFRMIQIRLVLKIPDFRTIQISDSSDQMSDIQFR